MELEDAKIWLRQVVRGELCDKISQEAISVVLEALERYEDTLEEGGE